MSMERLEFSEGTSNKFWTIELTGSSFTVSYGRIGTAGISQIKQFSTEEAAQVAYSKLLAEKVEKGYCVVSGNKLAVAKAPEADKIAVENAEQNIVENITSPLLQINETFLDSNIAEESATLPEFVYKRHIDFKPHEWFMAPWRPKVAYVYPKPAAFDFGLTLASIPKLKPFVENWIADLRDKKITPDRLSIKAATFWFRAIANYAIMGDPPGTRFRNYEATRRARVATVLQRVALEENNTAIDMSLVKQCFAHLAKPLPTKVSITDFVYPLLRLLSPLDMIDCTQVLSGHDVVNIMEQFRDYTLPYLDQPTVEKMREHLRPMLNLKQWQSVSQNDPPPPAYIWAAMIGMHDEISALINTWSASLFAREPKRRNNHYPQLFVLSLGSAIDVELHMTRLQLNLDIPKDVKAWIAHTEYSRLHLVKECIIDSQNKACFNVLACVKAPETASIMCELLAHVDFRDMASEWLTLFPEFSLDQVLSLASSRTRGFEAAKDILKTWKRQKVITDQLVGVSLNKQFREVMNEPEDLLSVHDETTTPQWLSQAFKEMAKEVPRLPTWIALAGIPAIVVEHRKLSPEQMKLVLTACQQSTLSEPHKLIEALKSNLSRNDLNRFTWTLFEGWLREGAKPKEKWAMTTLGLLGSDDTVLKLAPLIKRWPGESYHQRATLGIECLRTIGSDAALVQINGIAQKLKFAGLKERAFGCINEIATARDLSYDQLQDRIIPDCGLDEHGNRLFNYGQRQFSFYMGVDLKPMVRDSDGNIKSDLPKPGAKDDPELAAAAQEDWKLFKKLVKQVATIQAERLEQAMVNGKVWETKDFDQFLVGHPLMSHLIKGLIWAL